MQQRKKWRKRVIQLILIYNVILNMSKPDESNIEMYEHALDATKYVFV